MKLRVKGSPENSIRLRLLKSEVAELMRSGRVEETIRFAPGIDAAASLTFALVVDEAAQVVTLQSQPGRISVVVPSELAASWANTELVGLYASVDLGEHGALELIVEKDFACLDLSDAENADTFPHPQIGAAC